ncbi:hypothetical protein CK203_095062 [Vitis vinifera]|uniref:Uncharacterized protein n=1 Tax=Vitis vinifera TaxID=29760 RepID=A0A438EWL6_VITVI|nr:hypothetical protein CK203_095062 [Vitis vinifera]
MTTRLRSLKRLLSREKRVVPCSPGSVDVEQGGRGQSSKINSRCLKTSPPPFASIAPGT